MSAITVRNLPTEVERAIRRKARKEGLSLNRTVAKLLEEATGFAPRKKQLLHNDLDRFFGTWSHEEADTFDAALKEQRQVDPASWK